MAEQAGKVTTVCIKPDHDSGKQKIDHSDAMIVVIEGEATISSEKETKTVQKDDSAFIPKSTEFKISNKSEKDTIYVLITGNMKVQNNETTYR